MATITARRLFLARPLSQLRRMSPWWLAAIVAVSGLVTTLAAWQVSAGSGEAAARARFDGVADQITLAIQRRMISHEQILRGGGALFNLNNDLNRVQWRTYVAGLRLEETYPGILGVGFTRRLPAADLAQHVARVRAEGFPEYTVHPQQPRDEYHSIIYLEPFWGRNLRAFGYDMMTEPTRRAALERARDNGEPAMTRRVVLVQEGKQDVQPGFLLYFPVYRAGMPRGSVEERRLGLLGFVYSPFRARDLMTGILAGFNNDIAVEVFDGDAGGGDNLMFASAAVSADAPPRFNASRRLEFGGIHWTVRYSSLPAFEAAQPDPSRFVLFAGLVLTGFLAVLVMSLANTRNRAFAMARDMTSQLSESETRLRSVLASAAEGILTVSAAGRVHTANPAAERIFGLEGRDMDGKALDDLIVDHDVPRLCRIIEEQGIGVNAVARFEAQGRRATGENFPLAVSLSRTVDDGIARFTLMVRDVTEAKLTESILQLRERAIESSSNGIVIADMRLPGNPVIYVNPGFQRITGYSADEIIGRNCKLLQGGDAEQPGVKELALAIAGRRPASVLLRNYRKDGSLFWNELSVAPVFDEAGICTHYVGIQNDITQRVQAEDDLQVRKERLDAIFSLSPDGFVGFGADDTLTDVNPAFLRMTGFRQEELVGITEEEFDRRMQGLCDPALPYPPVRARIEDDGEGVPPIDGDRRSAPRHTLTLLKPEKRILQRSVRRGAEGSLEKVVYFRDVTRETEVDRLKSEFLSTAAHELRTPMASIFGFSELLLRRKYDETKTRELVGTINRQASILINLINELLDLARIEARAGKDFKARRQDPRALIENTVANLMVQNDPRRVLVTLGADIPAVDFDTEKLGLCLTNVLSNAYKYSPDGGSIELSTVTSAPGQRKALGIRVRDHGIGMTGEQVARVFERFYRADPSGNIPGTGLGMSLVKEIMELHGGDVDVESVRGMGTTVTLWLPLPEDRPMPLAA
ncbi:MAG: CHASE domain-containing protein [Rhodocyclaceae bacterium]|nr:CHASE domain-containing protein [Rhodocyclaceae bacterium]